MLEFIKKLFKVVDIVPEEIKEEPKRTIKDLEFFDDIWIKEEDVIYSGWIYEISRRCITVVYDNGARDYKFQIPRPLTLTEIEQDNKVLYCNNPNKNDNKF